MSAAFNFSETSVADGRIKLEMDVILTESKTPIIDTTTAISTRVNPLLREMDLNPLGGLNSFNYFF
jgi:hypothetical protein